MTKSVVVTGVVVLFMCGGGGEARTQEEVVPPNRIPKTVMDALHARFPRARIDKSTRANEENEVVYDLEFTEDGRKCEADIRENGTYINYEKAIPASDLPTAVRAAIDRRYPNATLNEVMEETEVSGKVERLSAYEVVLVTAGRKEVEVRVSPDGKILEDTGRKNE
jgi:hypothetical protein